MELKHGYCDFFLLPNMTHYQSKHSYILETEIPLEVGLYREESPGAMGRGRGANQRLCRGSARGSLAPGHPTPQNHHPVLRLGHGEDEGSVTSRTGDCPLSYSGYCIACRQYCPTLTFDMTCNSLTTPHRMVHLRSAQ